MRRIIAFTFIILGVAALIFYVVSSKRSLSASIGANADDIIRLAIKKAVDRDSNPPLAERMTPDKPWFGAYEKNQFKPLLSSRTDLPIFIDGLKSKLAEQAVEDAALNELCDKALKLNTKISQFHLIIPNLHTAKNVKQQLAKWATNLREYNIWPNDPRWLDSMAELAATLDEVKSEIEKLKLPLSEYEKDKAELELTLLNILDRAKYLTSVPDAKWDWEKVIKDPNVIFELVELKIHFFVDIKTLYQKYLKLKDTQFEPIVLKTKLKKGDIDPGVAAIKGRLSLEGIYSGEINEQLDDSLEEALKTFQRLHGLSPDGVIGKNTVDALNRPFSGEVEKIKLSFDRLRKSPARKYSRVLWINIPSFRLWLIDNGQVKFTTKVIVGKRNWIYWTPTWFEKIPPEKRPIPVSGPWNQSPTVESAVDQIIANPRWGTSNRIYEELLVEKSKDSAMRFDKEKYIWEIKPSGKIYLYQDPSRANLLGKVKISFPNPYSIFLHDTPSKNLFSNWPRDFSHGCIRVENPLELVKTIFELDNNEALKKWDQIIEDSVYSKTIKLNTPLPIVIDYITVAPNDWENIALLDDLYILDPPKSEKFEIARKKFYIYLSRLERLNIGTIWPRRD